MVDSPDTIAEGFRQILLENLIPFWFPKSVDEQHGGFYSSLDQTGALIDTDKSVWAQGRMSWALVKMFQTLEPRQEWLEWASSGVDFLESKCVDQDGRLFFHVTEDGRPIRKRRYAFSESFAAIAHASLFACTGKELHQRRALDLFRQFTRWSFEPGLADPKFCETRAMLGMGPRMITIVTARELLNDLEKSLSAEERGELNAWILQCVDEIERWFVKPDLEVVMETVGANGEILDHFDGRLLNPGHAIEGAWFIMWEAGIVT